MSTEFILDEVQCVLHCEMRFLSMTIISLLTTLWMYMCKIICLKCCSCNTIFFNRFLEMLFCQCVDRIQHFLSNCIIATGCIWHPVHALAGGLSCQWSTAIELFHYRYLNFTQPQRAPPGIAPPASAHGCQCESQAPFSPLSELLRGDDLSTNTVWILQAPRLRITLVL